MPRPRCATSLATFEAAALLRRRATCSATCARQSMPGCSTLYSTIHPVTGDQLVTRFPDEATDAGYVMDGILGAIFDPPEDASGSAARAS